MVQCFLPEIFFSFSILILLVGNTNLVKAVSLNHPLIEKELYCQGIFLFFCLLALYFNLKIEGFFSNLIFLNDESSRSIKIIVLLIAIASLSGIVESFSNQKLNFFEFFTLFLLSLFSLLLLVSAYDFISFYICIEMQSLCFYVLSSFKRNSVFSTEAGLKYFVTGSYISGVYLFGSSLIYLCTGTLNLSNLSLLLSFPIDSVSLLNVLLLIGIFCISFFLLFKISCAPFHFWASDVYEGSPLSTTIIFSVLPKIGIFSFLIKWFLSLGVFKVLLQGMFIPIGLFSVLFGTLFAISQKRVKRLVIYSSIAQVGFVVAALGLNSYGSLISIYFFLLVYVLTSILIWFKISVLNSSHNQMSRYYSKTINSLLISNLSNFFNKNSIWSFSFLIIFFSIAGIPPLTGFLSKIFIFSEFVRSYNLYFSIVFIIISSISAFYYLRIIKIVFFESNFESFTKDSFQCIVVTYMLNNISLFISIGLFFLIYFFGNPTMLYLISEHVSSSFLMS
jgi:NADH-quinone oxidoreductase subunit N